MKRFRLLAPTVLLSALLFSACSKEKSKVFNVSFYTPEPNTGIFLYIDDVYKGQLPVFHDKP